MKRILPLLLALVMTLALAAPALAAEDVFEASEAEEAAAPEAPIATCPRPPRWNPKTRRLKIRRPSLRPASSPFWATWTVSGMSQ